MHLVQKEDVVRYLFWTLWFVLVPAGFAFGIVVWSEHSTALGPIGDWIRDQRVPAGIVLFTLAEMTLYYFRHYLPYADALGTDAPRNLSRQTRREYEASVHLLDEAHRLFERHDKAIKSDVKTLHREQLNTALERLRTATKAEPFSADEMREAFTKAHDLVDRHLAPWRKSETREYVESIGIAIVIALALRAVVVEAFKIPSGSMLPTLQIDDHIFVNKFTYGPTLPFTKARMFSDLPPKRGDVIVFEFPDPDPAHEGDDFIKRVIALPGDTLEAKRGHPIINGWEVPSCKAGRYPYGPHDGHSSPYGDLYVEFLGDMSYLTVYEQKQITGMEGPFYVGPNEVYVMGDNRHNSHDSRRWRNGEGAGVPFENIRGRAMNVWLPLSRLMVPVMGHPALPDRVPQELKDGVERCLRERPAQTVPPPPKPAKR